MLHGKWKIILPFSEIYFSSGHFTWNYIPTIYYGARMNLKKGLCWAVFGRAHHLLLHLRTDVAILANVIPAWQQHTKRAAKSEFLFIIRNQLCNAAISGLTT